MAEQEKLNNILLIKFLYKSQVQELVFLLEIISLDSVSLGLFRDMGG